MSDASWLPLLAYAVAAMAVIHIVRFFLSDCDMVRLMGCWATLGVGVGTLAHLVFVFF